MNARGRRALLLLAVAAVVLVAVGGWWSREPVAPVAPERASEVRATGAAALPPSEVVLPAPVDAGVRVEPETKVEVDESPALVVQQLALNAELAEKHVQRFCDESRLLARGGIRPLDDRRARDASSFLGVRIDWEGDVRSVGLLHLSDVVTQRLDGYQGGWPSQVAESDFAGLDFQWMAALQPFDHWDLLREGPLRDAREVSWLTEPFPNFLQLRHWTKLRFGRARIVGDWSEAAADVQHLAALLRTTGLMMGDMAAVGLYRLEREAWETARAGGVDVSGWHPLEAEQLERLKRVSFASPFFFLPGVAPEVMKKALACSTASRCAALFEGIGAHASLARYAAQDTRDEVWQLASAAGCDAKRMASRRSIRPLTPEQAKGTIDPVDAFRKLVPDAGR